MGKVFIIISTILVMLIIGERNSRNNKRIFRVIKKVISEVNGTYIELFKEKSIFKRIIQIVLIIGAEVFIAIAISTSVIKYFDIYHIHSLDLIAKVLIIITLFIIIHFLMGYMLVATVKIHKFIYGVEDRGIKVDLLLSYFILSTYFTVLIISPEQFKSAYGIGLIGVAICYILNIKVLIRLIRNPHNVKSKFENVTSFKRIIIAALLIVVMILLTLFLAVCFINGSADGKAFTNLPNNFDLFYYTVITFTTVGYGDIAPITIPAKIVSIIISITSVICITVFLSTILSYRDKIESSKE